MNSEEQISVREPGECTPSSPLLELDSFEDSDDVIFVQEIPGKNSIRNDSCESIIATDDNNISLLECFDSEMMDSTSDSMFVLDRTGTVNGVQESLPEKDLGSKGHHREKFKNKKKVKKLNMSMVLTFSGTPEPSSEADQKSTKKATCFNCGGNHLLDDCDAPRDAKRIAKNRSAHYRKTCARYTTDLEVSAYKPGVISKELREALGIGNCDIPEWIYRMRRLGFIDGYPPAYLKRAIEGERQTVLKFYMDDSSFEDDYTNDSSEAECFVPKINKAKMLKYPGFNVDSAELNDRERNNFRIPSFSDFVDYHQCALSNKIKMEREKKQKSSSKRRCQEKANAKCKKTRNDIEVLDNNKSASASSMSSVRLRQEKCEEIASTSAESSKPIEPVAVSCVQSLPSVLAMSTSKYGGTLQGTDSNVKPDLEKFRKGIVPFEAREDVNLKRGFFKELMRLMKKNGANNY
uniref:PSP domain-containing protein n=1 Tax=Syphacia muris TaxID=451379 RepID=A0A158R5Q5_9BILA